MVQERERSHFPARAARSCLIAGVVAIVRIAVRFPGRCFVLYSTAFVTRRFYPI
jgi:hypothetical protein